MLMSTLLLQPGLPLFGTQRPACHVWQSAFAVECVVSVQLVWLYLPLAPALASVPFVLPFRWGGEPSLILSYAIAKVL